ncbi:hypothetical protein CBS63078_3587 [Aspergillus niger]|uniref:Contig An08c0130, genomic contig n=3 Tax=Aspergillus niger TaxID=5061 RepID=A2QR78_ASPNC|nr:uncharacterized protein An08g05070 [Aspergillus niger]XP_025456951.1 uncharacterized protein BO96DRAFT_229540 [Aspergillus niger CBS 101883]RDH19124.1 hypothetical protein M747DRAFT_261955 [Aspergillus niger ATCC 13496]KAI2820799.1 hypothetical protein CBS115989_3402 [Aspergillus niger]KAI2828621.1 hypothetical protein CBS133816_5260 [Aspergillus niger]KAI2844903.1 hypothetical protein CBS11350_4429 [Aspergillus niger]KAI2854581.1 hypothetical protein CBS11232_4911 [Aspergillus niger]|eukprot:XP_001392624.1 hypothetical protein ANI_1_734074 [Aspergillus niger CBS 513.88]
MSATKSQIPDQLPWDPNCTQFPSRKELPKIPGAPDGAAWVWGKDDSLGRLNLLTPERVKAAAAEIQTGEMIRLDLPLNVPNPPAFERQSFEHNIKELIKDIVFDDTYSLNTQSGTQWDGFRHFAHGESKTFYNNTKAADIIGPSSTDRCSIHHWATHGIAGRAILLDYKHYADTHSITYDPYTTHRISYASLQACAQSQGLDLRPASQGGDIKPGDILFIRSGFIERYYALTPERRAEYVLNRPHTDLHFAGLSQEEPILDWLHDCYFAAVAGDSPTFEAWPPEKEDGFIHQQILALWGMPLGEMWDFETLARRCREIGRWVVFVTSAPANVVGGVGSHANAMAIL